MFSVLRFSPDHLIHDSRVALNNLHNVLLAWIVYRFAYQCLGKINYIIDTTYCLFLLSTFSKILRLIISKQVQKAYIITAVAITAIITLLQGKSA